MATAHWISAGEQRVSTKSNPDRYRIPDVCVTDSLPAGVLFLSEPPRLCIEILSPDDKAVELQVKIEKSLDFGVPYVWIIDPVTRIGEIHTPDGIEKIRNGIFKAGRIEVDLSQLQ